MGLTGLKRFFSWKKAYADHFCKVSSDLKPFWQVTIFHTRLPHKPNHGLGLRQGWNSETYKNEFEWLKTIFFMKEGIRDHFCKVSSDLKPFWQVTMFHTRLPHKPNHGLGLRQGVKFWNLQKWVWMGQNDIFHERRHTRSFLQSFKWFKAILTSYHISHQTSPQTNYGLGLRQGWNYENLQKWVWIAQNDIFHERRHTRSFLQSFKWFKAILTSYHISHQTSPQTKSWIGT